MVGHFFISSALDRNRKPRATASSLLNSLYLLFLSKIHRLDPACYAGFARLSANYGRYILRPEQEEKEFYLQLFLVKCIPKFRSIF